MELCLEAPGGVKWLLCVTEGHVCNCYHCDAEMLPLTVPLKLYLMSLPHMYFTQAEGKPSPAMLGKWGTES